MNRLKLLLVLLILAACQKEKDTLSLSTSNIDISDDIYVSQITISSNTAWNISGGDGWITYSPSSGTGTATVTVTVAKNTSDDSRSANLTVTAGSLTQTIAVSQKQKNALILTRNLEAFPNSGGSSIIELKSNISYNVTVPVTATWLTLTQTKAMSTFEYSLQVSQNTSLSSRSAKIIFKDKTSNLSDTLEVFQDGPEQISLTTKNFYIAKSGATITFDLTYNIDYEMTMSSGIDWISTAATKATYTKNYSFVVSQNNSGNDRFASLIFTQKSVPQGKKALADTVIIKQTSFDGTYIYLDGTQTLSSQLPSSGQTSIQNLKIEGKMKSADFSTIRNNIINLKNIDLRDAIFEGDSLPSEAFLMTTPVSLLESALLPSTIQKIGKHAFNGCAFLKSITIPASVKSIGTLAFNACISLETINSNITKPFEITNVFSGIHPSAILIVPTGSLNSYQTTKGWGYTFFKNICETGTNPQDYLRFDKYVQNSTGLGGNYSVEINATGSWSVEKKPVWITLNSSSGSAGKSNIDLTFASYNGPTMREDSLILKLNNSSIKAILKVRESGIQYDEGDFITLQRATIGAGVDIVIMGDGYDFDEVVSGKYETKIKEAYTHFFDIEPYKTYQQYFNVYMVYAYSPESGISDLTTTVRSSFGTRYTSAPPSTGMTTTAATVLTYAAYAPIKNIQKTLVIIVANSSRYGGTCIMYGDGKAIAMCPTSVSIYPYDFRGLVQHEAGGHGFGKLADEYTNHSETIPEENINTLRQWQGYGQYMNVDVTNNLTTILWKHFIGIQKYAGVGAYEGGYYYTKGVWRPESNSAMINNIKYYNAPSREQIVKKIKTYAGMTYSFEDFMANDIVDSSPATKAAGMYIDPRMILAPPILIP
ncbi:MAG: M64 family metallo-endopeptidase [Bacteroidales bacterium]|nr:M64 family metallo-endopeptidase [Bacteroidales bacterium]